MALPFEQTVEVFDRKEKDALAARVFAETDPDAASRIGAELPANGVTPEVAAELIVEQVKLAAVTSASNGSKRPGKEQVFIKAHLDYVRREVAARQEELADLQKQWLESCVLEVAHPIITK